MDCRSGCGACCIATSISSTIPGMPNGKPADVTCIHLTSTFLCNIFYSVDRPKVCQQLKPNREMCCTNRDDALIYLRFLEKETAP